MSTHPSVPKLWNQYLASIGEDFEETEKMYVGAWHFCDNEQDANELVELVKSGKKTATSSLHALYERDNEWLPFVGDYNVITNFAGVAQCIIEVTAVDVIPFQDVAAEFAAAEGEGDLSLDYWRTVHREFFSREWPEFTEEMLVVCERFRVVYPS